MLSRDAQSCRKVQDEFDLAASNADTERILELAAEMHGHVWEASRCPHANFVLQKLILISAMHCGPQSVQFVVNELLFKRSTHAAVRASQHKFACRIVQRLLEVCSPEQVERLVAAILTDAAKLCTDPFGNYVMQHILDYGNKQQAHSIMLVLTMNAEDMSANDAACAVLTKGLSRGSPEDQVALARALLANQELFISMACSRHGHQAANLTIQVLDEPDRYNACRELSRYLNRLRTSGRWGRVLAATIDLYNA